jgi:hypothetical protein
MINRLKASCILAPAILLLLCSVGRFVGADEVARVGIVPFVLWAGAAAIVMAYLVTLYVSFVATMMFKH